MKKKVCLFIVIIFFIITIVYYTCDKIKIRANTQNENINQDNVKETNEDYIKPNIIGILKIEKINLEAEIKEGSSNKVLKSNIGHIENTPIYDGNIGLAAHNRGNKYSYFSKINELENGDSVLYKTRYGIREYRVFRKSEINETDWSYLEDTKENIITMITCIKNKFNKRLCVQAIQV